MSKKDTLTKQFLGQDEVFADAFNYYLFNGKQVIRPEDLKAQDPTEIAVIRKQGQLFPHQRFRDVLKHCTIRCNNSATFILLGIEAQSFIHYAMPIRDYLYDALNYAAQVETIRKKHLAAHDLHDSAGLLSGFTKRDKILPVITLCICFDNTAWDAPRSLYDLFGEVDPWITEYVDDYRLNLITPDEIQDFNRFSSDLGLVLEYIKNSGDNKRLRDIIESKETYQCVDVSTVDMINAYTATNISTKNADGGKIDMCKAIQDMMEESRVEGHAEGQKEIADTIKTLRASGMSADQILKKIERDAKRNARTRKKRR